MIPQDSNGSEVRGLGTNLEDQDKTPFYEVGWGVEISTNIWMVSLAIVLSLIHI